ncbi:MAG: GTPase Obg [Chlamydiales bacterium]|nr:GTPase Obg [Chlamydiales bacterium]
MFVDKVVIELHAGKGGNGVVAWRREKYLPKGGPYGGNGGKGGSIIIEADNRTYSLEAYRHKRILKAENGVSGGSNNRRGRNGKELVIKVPCGTLVKDKITGEILYDITDKATRIEICEGGRGGFGNTHFKSPTNRAPNTCTPGRIGKTTQIELELKLIADVGLVGFPNAGKSTFIASVSSVPVKIAPYPFTTLRPNLGYVMEKGSAERLLIADIPGIIEGAHRNRGLGHKFLRHIERTHVLLFVLDASGFEGRDPVEDFSVLRRELALYNSELLEKPYAILLNKTDVEGSSEIVKNFREMHPASPMFETSALTGEGLEKVITFLKRELLKTQQATNSLSEVF